MNTTKISWYIWKWNKGCNTEFLFDNIIVSKSWIEAHMNEKGQVVKGPFEDYTDALRECTKLNEIEENKCNFNYDEQDYKSLDESMKNY